MRNRLTWDTHAPAPYESAWSVFLKVLSVNHMTMRELVVLIKKEPGERKNIYSVPYLDDRWIDFERYASLLDVEATRLKDGFLKNFNISASNPHVRHCPKCFELGYHCTLFLLPIIRECPWHRCELVNSCSACGSTIGLEPFRSIPTLKAGCHLCKADLSTFTAAPRFNSLDASLTYAIIGYCRELIDWWQKVRERTLLYSPLIDTFLSTESSAESDIQLAQYQLGHIKTLIKDELWWRFSVAEKPARLISRTYRVREREEQSNNYLSDDAGHSYRSIRRRIYYKHLRSHHPCIKALLKLSRGESLFLHKGRVCVPALAFLTWRMSVEGICNIEGLRSARTAKIPLRLMRRGELSLKDQIQWTYDGFFGLLAALENYVQKYHRMIIYLNDNEVCDGFLPCQFDEQKNGQASGSAEQRKFMLSMLRPEAECLNERKCAISMVQSASASDYLCDRNAFDQAQNWAWGNDPTSHRALFKLTQSEERERQMFQYFNV